MHIRADSVERSFMGIDNFFVNDPPSAAEIGSMNWFRGVIQPQDTRAMELQQLGMSARGYSQGRLMVDRGRTWRSEHTTHLFDLRVWLALNAEGTQVGGGEA